MEELNLKPCPFCGGEAEIIASPHSLHKMAYTPRCKDRSCCGRTVKKWVELDTAVYAWNRRPRKISKADAEDFDKIETYNDCTVRVLTNTETGETGVDWWRNEDDNR